MRFGMTPLYLGFEEIWLAVEQLYQILDSAEWTAPQFSRKQAVT